MGKRIITRVGDVFCAEIDGEYKSYFVAKKFWEINWKYDEHITSEEFETVWNKKQ